MPTVKKILKGRRPTIRQERLADELILNMNRKHPKTKKEMLVQVRYGKISEQPSRIIESAGVQKALADRLPDNLLQRRHLQLLNKKETVLYRGKVLKTGEIDVNAVAKGLDMAYRVKGSYAPVKGEYDHRVGVFSMSDLRKKTAARKIEITDSVETIMTKFGEDPENDSV